MTPHQLAFVLIRILAIGFAVSGLAELGRFVQQLRAITTARHLMENGELGWWALAWASAPALEIVAAIVLWFFAKPLTRLVVGREADL